MDSTNNNDELRLKLRNKINSYKHKRGPKKNVPSSQQDPTTNMNRFKTKVIEYDKERTKTTIISNVNNVTT